VIDKESSLRDLPEDWQSKPPSIDRIPQGVFVIQCDASYKDGISGISTVIKTKDREYRPIEYSARSKGPVHSELTAIYKALRRLETIRLPIRVCIIYTDNRYACNFLERLWSPQRDYIRDIVDKVAHEFEELLERMEVFLCHTRTKYNKRVDRRAGKKRKEEENKKTVQIEKRIENIEGTIIRGREIGISEVSGEYFAIPKKNGFPPGYRVSLDPPCCECPWWKYNWSNKGDYIVKARALPCKHICALAEYLGRDIYQLFGKSIRRRD